MNLADTYRAFLSIYPLRHLTLDGARWELIEAGEGAGVPVVLLPGGFGIAATSFQYLSDLAADYRVLALSYPPLLERIAALADGVAALLDHCGIARAHIVGGSASGAVAQVLVRRHPARVCSLILAQTGPPQTRRAWVAQALAAGCQRVPAALSLALLRAAVLAFLPERSADHTFWRAHFTAVIATHSRASLACRLRTLADYDRNYQFLPSDLDTWTCRVAIIESEHDGMLSATERSALRQLYPQASLHLLVGSHHADSVTAPARQLAALRAALHLGQ